MLIKAIAESYKEYAGNLRRQFHQYPEEGRKEYVTSRMICEELENMGLFPRVLCETGVIVDIGNPTPNGHIACIRADIDGLQVKEETGVPYASRHEGFMHACGHDAHIAMALTAAKILKEMEKDIHGTVRILFEPGEENSDGAKSMIRAGALEGVETIYGTHVWAGIPSGKFSAEKGPRMAYTNQFTICIQGKSTHGSMPHKGTDPIMTAASMMQNIQSAFSREFPPTETALVSFCQIHGGNTNNAIPDQVTIGGTTRAFWPEIQEQIQGVMRRVVEDTAHIFRVNASLSYSCGSPAVINDEAAAHRAAKAIQKNYGEQALVTCPASTGGEDFSDYLNVVPGVFVFLGIDDEKIGAVYPNHNSHFNFDEEILWKGAAAAVQYCVDYLDEK